MENPINYITELMYKKCNSLFNIPDEIPENNKYYIQKLYDFYIQKEFSFSHTLEDDVPHQDISIFLEIDFEKKHILLSGKYFEEVNKKYYLLDNDLGFVATTSVHMPYNLIELLVDNLISLCLCYFFSFKKINTKAKISNLNKYYFVVCNHQKIKCKFNIKKTMHIYHNYDFLTNLINFKKDKNIDTKEEVSKLNYYQEINSLDIISKLKIINNKFDISRTSIYFPNSEYKNIVVFDILKRDKFHLIEEHIIPENAYITYNNKLPYDLLTPLINNGKNLITFE